MASVAIDGKDRLHPHLDRSRRNLVISSCILSILSLPGANVGNTIPAVFLDVSFEEPGRVVDMLWIIWAYFLYRFLVHFRSSQLSSKDFIDYRTFFLSVSRLAAIEARRLVDRDGDWPKVDDLSDDLHEIGREVREMEPGTISETDYGLRYHTTWMATIRVSDGRSVSRNLVFESLTFSKSQLRQARIHGHLREVLFGANISDYCLPLLIAAMPLAVIVYEIASR